MRSSKSRSRGKNRNNNRPSGGNIINRVFDSSGPEGKVRGTPQQIIDKYTQLARDAQLSGDRVAFENFQQHAEHYTRILAEANREIEAKREAQEAANKARQEERDRERAERDRQRAERQEKEAAEAGATVGSTDVVDPAEAPQPDFTDVLESGDAGLVETPEAAPKPKRKPRKPKPKPAPEAETPDNPEAPEAAE